MRRGSMGSGFLRSGSNSPQSALKVLRTGQIVNTYEGLASREKPGITERTVRARAGAGGAYFKFTVGDGTVNIRRAAQ